MSDEFAGNLIQGIDKLARRLEMSKFEIAEDLLDSVLNDEPKPPWNTGELRRSIKVYIGSKEVATAPQRVPPNSRGSYAKSGYKRWQTGMAKKGGLGAAFGRLTKNKTGISVVDTISVIADAPDAQLMHEVPGWNYSDPASGAFFISSKLWTKLPVIFAHRMKKVFR